MPILSELHKVPVGSRGAIVGFLYGGMPLPPYAPLADYSSAPPPLPLLLGKVGKYRLGGPLYPAYAPTVLRITGVTKDSTGAVLPACTVDLFRTLDNRFVDSVISDGSGAYEFRTAGPAETYYIVAYLAGSPDVAGTTVNTLTGT